MSVQIHTNQTASAELAAVILHAIVVLDLAAIRESPRLIVETEETGEFEFMRMNVDGVRTDSDHL